MALPTSHDAKQTSKVVNNRIAVLKFTQIVSNLRLSHLCVRLRVFLCELADLDLQRLE